MNKKTVRKMADLLAVPFKKPTDVDVSTPLINLIASTYNTGDKAEDYSDQINEFSKLRNNAIWRVFEKFETSLEVIYGYYDQLHALEGKIPPSDVQIPFKWKDAFNKGSLFVGRISLTLSSLAYERVCILFNIAALQSAVAANQCIESDEGLKLAAKLLQQASGIFSHLKSTVISAMQVEPTPDLNPETLSALSSLMLAQAQEIFVFKAIHDRMKDVIIAKLSAQCEEYYMDALKQMQKECVRQLWEKDWIPLVAGKQSSYHGLAEYYQSNVCKATKAVGEEIARLTDAVSSFKNGQTKSGRPDLLEEYVGKAERALVEAKKDNDFIYHERIPSSVQPIGRVPLAKPLPFPQHFSSNFKDLFENLVPMPVHQAMAAYEVRKNELVNREINELRKATQLLNGVLSSLNLPAALEDNLGESVPQSLLDKSASVTNLGGVNRLQGMIAELPDLLQRNTDILNETERLLTEEESSDKQLREQFKEKWSRTSSEKLTETFKANINKYRELINNAIHADKVIRDKYEMHKRGMELLSSGPEAMKGALPTCDSNSTSNTDSPASHRLSQLMEEVETMKAERDTIELELKSATRDMKETFLAALANDGTINEVIMSSESLGKVYGPLQQQVKESISRQHSLLAKIQDTNTEFTMERSGGSGLGAKREAVLKELAAAHDAFIELQNNLNEGTKFYNDLTQVLIAFQNKISDFCFARKTEKDELLKDLTQEMSRDSGGPSPKIPSHHTSTDIRKDPPPRPPPPSIPPQAVSASLPYPMQPAGMPIPYATGPSVPYPTQPYYLPLPPGYNPYATIAGYPHQPPAASTNAYQYGTLPPYTAGNYMGGHQQAPGQHPPPQGPW